MNNRVVVAAEDFVDRAVRCVAGAIIDAGRRGSPITVALSGGSTPEPVYSALAAYPGVPWPDVEIFQVDERAVRPEHHQSNYGMILRSLLSAVPGLATGSQRMRGERSNLEAEANRYSTLLPGRLDVVVLGIGTDGHTASLFPGQPAALELARRVVPAEAPDPPRRRLTLTRPVLERAGALVVLAAGAAKAEAVHRALEEPGPVVDCPARIARSGTWVLDAEAASLL